MRRYPVFLLGLVAVLLCATAARGFMFQLSPGSERCFTQEIPSNTDVTIAYGSNEGYGNFLDCIITNPEGSPIFTQLGKNNDIFAEHLIVGGEYTICFTSRLATKNSKTVRSITLSVRIGADAKDYTKIATTDKLRPMEVQLRVMEDTVAEVHNEFIYLKDREAEMRSTNEHMTAMVMWMSIGLIVLFAAFSYLQMRHLKRYFKKKRMID